MEKFSNDTTLTRLGDDYHHLIALEECLQAKRGEIIYIEQLGDVATKDKSIEVKHHHDENYTMGDRHIDFWKTLKNWVDNFEILKGYSDLILLTTAKITTGTKLELWNTSNENEKMKILIAITDEKVTESIQPYVKKIFSFNNIYKKSILKSVLRRVKIQSGQPRIQEKIKEITNREFFKSFPRKNRNHFLYTLLSYIDQQRIDNPTDWKIEIDRFNYFTQMNSTRYSKKAIPIPDLFRNAEANVGTYNDYNFIKEIRKIDLEHRVKSAANDYFRAQQTVNYLLENDPLIPEELTYYQNSIILEDLQTIKDEHLIDYQLNPSKENAKRLSQKCYFSALKMPLKNVKGYYPNRDFFQKGTIHNLVNSNNNDFSWLIYKGKNGL